MLVCTKEKLENVVADFVSDQLKSKQTSPEMVVAIAELIKSIA